MTLHALTIDPVDSRVCKGCGEPGFTDPFSLFHTGCCSHENVEAGTGPEGQTDHSNPSCSDCGADVEPDFNEDGPNGWNAR